MKAALILALVLGIEPQGVRDRESRCDWCEGHGAIWYWHKEAGLPYHRVIERCWNCDGYGKERTMYGRLLRP